jgi:hypothetical protein
MLRPAAEMLLACDAGGELHDERAVGRQMDRCPVTPPMHGRDDTRGMAASDRWLSSNDCIIFTGRTVA